MKKIFGLVILIVVCTSLTQAQTATNKIDSTGNVGIGTLSPISLLHVNGTIRSSNELIISRTSNAVRGIHLEQTGHGDSPRFVLSGTSGAYSMAVLSGGLSFRSDAIYNSASGIERMRLTSSELNIRVNTDINGSLKTTGAYTLESANPTMIFKETGISNNDYDIQVNNGDFKILKVDDTRSTFENVFTILDNENIGIGSSYPEADLHIKESSIGAPSLLIQRKGYVGGSGGEAGAELGTILFKNDHTNNYGAMIKGVISPSGWADNAALDFYVSRNNSYNMVMRIDSDENVGIGVTDPAHKLDVSGTIHSEEVIVDLNVEGPDYVFEEDYALPSLSEIEAFIKANKHLPEIPSAKEMEENGIILGEMNMLLLKKIEELTLHAIAQEKAKDKQQSINEEQRELINQLLKRVEQLEKKGEQ
ncbi:MAG: hypothetical protein ACMZ7B_01655 [Balneola sp.]